MYKEAIVYYPSDEKLLKQMLTDITILHCAAAVEYMEILGMSDRRKAEVIDSIMQDLTKKAAEDVSHGIV